MGKPGWLDLLRKLNYDTALSANPTAFGALLKLVDARRILFGTDYPFAGAGAVTSARNNLAALGLTSTQLQDIEGENAVRLFARFAR